jgi:hypothetical protein
MGRGDKGGGEGRIRGERGEGRRCLIGGERKDCRRLMKAEN